jgi:hypothetical protein
MKRIVFCTEFGSNYGHISGFIRLHKALLLLGYDVVFILRSLTYANLLGPNIQCVQAPIPKLLLLKRQTFSYADMIAQFGYVDVKVLTDYIADWQDRKGKCPFAV